MRFGVTEYLMIGSVLLMLLPRVLVGCVLIGFARWLWLRTGERKAGRSAAPSAPEGRPAAGAPASSAADGRTLAPPLRPRRSAAGYSQELQADRLGVSRQAVSKWVTGSAAPSTGHLLALADLYGVTVDELLRGR